MEKYLEVPNILTSKDLNYLSDSFEWNILSLKKTNDSIPKVNDEEIKSILKEACNLFDANLKTILSMLDGGKNE